MPVASSKDNNRCGPLFNTICTSEEECCSKDWMCGSGQQFCNEDSQIKYSQSSWKDIISKSPTLELTFNFPASIVDNFLQTSKQLDSTMLNFSFGVPKSFLNKYILTDDVEALTLEISSGRDQWNQDSGVAYAEMASSVENTRSKFFRLIEMDLNTDKSVTNWVTISFQYSTEKVRELLAYSGDGDVRLAEVNHNLLMTRNDDSVLEKNPSVSFLQLQTVSSGLSPSTQSSLSLSFANPTAPVLKQSDIFTVLLPAPGAEKFSSGYLTADDSTLNTDETVPGTVYSKREDTMPAIVAKSKNVFP